MRIEYPQIFVDFPEFRNRRKAGLARFLDDSYFPRSIWSSSISGSLLIPVAQHLQQVALLPHPLSRISLTSSSTPHLTPKGSGKIVSNPV